MSEEKMLSVRMKVNGKPYQRDVHATSLLVDFLRYDLGLTGTKEGCGVGVCGACTVLLDGKMVSSCLTLAVMADGQEVTTVEGISQNGQRLGVQKSFTEQGGFQCGICTPGQIVAAKALLDHNPNPTADDIKDWMRGNLCRCTGYYGILRSIQASATKSGEKS